MAVLDRVRDLVSTEELTKLPTGIDERLKRGRQRMREGATKRNECLKFWRGEQYVYPARGALISQSTTSEYEGRGKPRHRVRTTRNLIADIVAHEVSAATQRVPSYEINPTTSDPEDITAARVAEKVARFLFDKARVRQVTEKVVTYAVVADEGFAWPYWDSTVGPYFEDEEGKVVGEGEVAIRTFGPNEVYWEPGLSFEDSPWHAIEQARTIESVRQTEGFIGGTLESDARGEDDEPDPNSKLCLVTEYLERPSLAQPHGRWLTMAAGRLITEERPYPCQDHEGNVVDEPVLHKLSYTTDPANDRDMGLVRHLLDAQRTVNDCTNKQLEWKNTALVPQLAIMNGGLAKGQRITDEPGQVIHLVGGGEFKFREVPAIPPELSRLKEEAKADMARIAAQNDIPGNIESGRAIQALIEKDTSRRAGFIANLADFHSRLMRHCLYLVQRHYTEPRLLMVRGEDGTEPVRDFLGANIRGQVDVTVWPGSIEPRTRAALEGRLTQIAQMFPGRFTPEEIMRAMERGTAEDLLKSYERDIRRARSIIQHIKDQTFWDIPNRPVFPDEDPGPELDENKQPIPQIDPATGQQASDEMGLPMWVPATTVAGWMPRPVDDVGVWKVTFADFMKSDDYDRMDEEQQKAAMSVYGGLLGIEKRELAKQAEEQRALAEGQGMSNAARPTKTPPLPSQPAPESLPT